MRSLPAPSLLDRFTALSNPTRRAIFELLADAPSPVGLLARKLPVTRPAVSQHLKILQDAGLVAHETLGTRNIYRVDPLGVAAVRDYLDSLWQRALIEFQRVAEETYQENQPK